MKKNKISKDWLRKQKKDPFVKQSKIQGYRSRSAFKLIEMNNKFQFIKKNTNLLDIGSCPGGWSQVVQKKIIKGKILAVDIKNMEKINNVDFINGDFRDLEIYNKIMLYFNNKADVVISDMAENTSGNKSLDSYRTGQLCLNSISFAKKILLSDGIFVSKVFMGSAFDEIIDKSKKTFKNIIRFKPKSSKKESKEIYIICKGVLKI